MKFPLSAGISVSARVLLLIQEVERLFSAKASEKAKTMKMNDRLNGFAWGICVGALVAIITGLTMGWVVTGSRAELMARKGAEAALVTAMTPICVDRFQRAEGFVDKLAALKKIDASWERRNYVQKGDWAKIGQTSSFELADACADALNKL